MMIRQLQFLSTAATVVALVLGGALLLNVSAEEPVLAVQPLGTESEHLVVPLCDGKTQIEVRDYKPGQQMDRVTAQSVADAMMSRWQEMNPGASWEMAMNAAAPAAASSPDPAPAASQAASAQPTKQDEIYGRYTERDEFVWRNELKKFVAEGNRIFHDASAFGGTVGVSCDMCHPNASNTHPETYPKYQVQIQRIALLRDMVNWCIEHATKGKPLADDDPRLRAMEAYILFQRAGKAITPGKH